MNQKSSKHQLSPSSWNRFEECPRKYWLSKQGLPRKSSMAASLGTAIHNSLEDICNLDLRDRGDIEAGWLEQAAMEVLEENWEEERDVFLSAPRHPNWKPEQFKKAKDGLFGAIRILMSRADIETKELSEITVGNWKQIQEIVISNEGTLTSNCGRLMGRLDLLISTKDQDNQTIWIVADLKTGKPPKEALSENVSRQLRFYRDLLKHSNPDHPPLKAEGWYSANETIHEAEGPSVLEDAFSVWEKTKPSEKPLEAKPNDSSCSFCDWKAWCPSWWAARRDGTITPGGMFRDEVVRLVRFDDESGAALFERAPPIGEDGDLSESTHRFGAILKDSALDSLSKLKATDSKKPLFLGSVRAQGKIIHLGHWSEVMEWSPIN